MNPITQIKSRQKQRESEVLNGIPDSASYHSQYKRSAYIFAGQLNFKLTEGDLLAIFSEYGEVVDVNLVRDKKSGDSRGFAYIAYEDQRSTDLAVDNLNGFSVAGRLMAVDHVLDYKRLRENPDAVQPADESAPVPEPPQQEGSGAEEGRILAGADAEEAEDTYGVTADAAPPAGGGGAGQPWEDGGGSIAAMLRSLEAETAARRKRGAAAAAAADDEEDPLTAMRATKLAKADKKHKKEKKEKKEKKYKADRHEPDALGPPRDDGRFAERSQRETDRASPALPDRSARAGNARRSGGGDVLRDRRGGAQELGDRGDHRDRRGESVRRDSRDKDRRGSTRDDRRALAGERGPERGAGRHWDAGRSRDSDRRCDGDRRRREGSGDERDRRYADGRDGAAYQ